MFPVFDNPHDAVRTIMRLRAQRGWSTRRFEVRKLDEEAQVDLGDGSMLQVKAGTYYLQEVQNPVNEEGRR